MNKGPRLNLKKKLTDIKKSETAKISDYFSKVNWNKEFLGLNADLMYEKFVDIPAVNEFTPK